MNICVHFKETTASKRVTVMRLDGPEIGFYELENILYLLSKSSRVELIGDKKFIDPSFWAILRCEKLRRARMESNLEIMADEDFKESRAYKYLLKITDRESSSTTVPIKDFAPTNIDSADSFAEDFINLLPVADSELSSFLKYIVRELVTNAIDHSDSIINTICAGQMFPNIGESEIVVVDAGVGFLNTLKRKYKELKNDDDAIEKAIQKGVTGYTKRSNKHHLYNKNSGFGLYVISRIIERFGGLLKIISRKGSLTLTDGYVSNKSLYETVLWRGSIVIVRLKYGEFFDMTLEDFLKILRKEDKGDEDDLF